MLAGAHCSEERQPISYVIVRAARNNASQQACAERRL